MTHVFLFLAISQMRDEICDMNNNVCPLCHTDKSPRKVKKRVNIIVRGESTYVLDIYNHCTGCQQPYDNKDYDVLDVAYRAYRKKHNMLQPEDIRMIREYYGLTQKDFSRLIGWGEAQFSRFENGALQSNAFDKMLRLMQYPENIKRLGSPSNENVTVDESIDYKST